MINLIYLFMQKYHKLVHQQYKQTNDAVSGGRELSFILWHLNND